MACASLTKDEKGVASTVATIMALLVVLALISAMINAYVPSTMKDNEYIHSNLVRSQFINLRNTIDSELSLAGATQEIDDLPSTSLYSPISLGPDEIPVLASPSRSSLKTEPNDGQFSIEWQYARGWGEGEVERVDQDVILVIDSSTSMRWNDPHDLRLDSARRYIENLVHPDRVAIIDFDHRSYLVPQNIGLPGHHLSHPGHNGVPDYECAKDDIDTIDSWGWTNFGWALHKGNNELINYGDRDHALVQILLTDGRNNRRSNDTQALQEAQRAKEHGIIIFTIGLGGQDFHILEQIAETTGGAYYNAPDPSSLDWIYCDISSRFTSESGCAAIRVSQSASGRIELNLNNRYYPKQDFVFENGAVILRQSDGEVVVQGPSLSFTKSSAGGLEIRYKLISITGDAKSITGTGGGGIYTGLTAYSSEDYIFQEISLTEVDQKLASVEQDIQDKLEEGGKITEQSAESIQDELEHSRESLNEAIEAINEGNLGQARDEVDNTISNLNGVVEEIRMQRSENGIQGWYADYLTQEVRKARCDLNMWIAWMDGITFTISGEYVGAWMKWFNDSLRPLGNERYAFDLTDENLKVALFGVTSLHLEFGEVRATF